MRSHTTHTVENIKSFYIGWSNYLAITCEGCEVKIPMTDEQFIELAEQVNGRVEREKFLKQTEEGNEDANADS